MGTICHTYKLSIEYNKGLLKLLEGNNPTIDTEDDNSITVPDMVSLFFKNICTNDMLMEKLLQLML